MPAFLRIAVHVTLRIALPFGLRIADNDVPAASHARIARTGAVHTVGLARIPRTGTGTSTSTSTRQTVGRAHTSHTSTVHTVGHAHTPHTDTRQTVGHARTPRTCAGHALGRPCVHGAGRTAHAHVLHVRVPRICHGRRPPFAITLCGAARGFVLLSHR
ncbi:hypothetical protein SSPIM334S_01494 [Streptomyces spiroverticillatus]